MADKFGTWGKAEGEADPRAFRSNVDVLTSNTYYREEVAVTGTTGGPPIPIQVGGYASAAVTQMDVTTVASAVPSTNLTGRKSVTFKALAANGAPVYLGVSTAVNTTNGFEVSAGGTLPAGTDATVQWYVIAASGTQRLSVFEQG